MGIRYSFAGAEERSVNVYLDHDYIVKFKPTTDWDTWDTAYVDLDLINGDGVLKFISMTEEGGPNIDAFGFSVEGVTRKLVSADSSEAEKSKDSVTTKVNSLETRGFGLVGDVLRVSNPGTVNVKVFSMDGRLVAESSMNVQNGSVELPLSSMVRSTGLFHVVARQGQKIVRSNWVNMK